MGPWSFPHICDDKSYEATVIVQALTRLMVVGSPWIRGVKGGYGYKPFQKYSTVTCSRSHRKLFRKPVFTTRQSVLSLPGASLITLNSSGMILVLRILTASWDVRRVSVLESGT